MFRFRCCLNCSDRVVGCHGSCETYKREVEEFRQGNAKYKEQQSIELEYQRYLQGRYKARRNSRRRKR